MDNEKTIIDVRDAIMNKMDSEGRSLQWLADTTGINYNTLHSCIKRKLFNLSADNLMKINFALETNFIQE